MNTTRKPDPRIATFAATGLVTMLAALSTILPSAAQAQTASPDFSLAPTIAGQALSLGYLVRGGLPLCTANCFGGLVEPKAESCLADFTCTTPIYTTTDIQVISANGFLGTVGLEMLNLPPGVTSLLPASVTIVAGSGFPPFASTRFSLKADSTAPLGTSTVTVRATSGLIIHTIDYQITVVDALPPLSSDGQLGLFQGIQIDSQFTSGSFANVVAGTSTTGFAWVSGAGAAPGGVTVVLTSSNPAVAGKYKGQIPWPVNPQTITVKSSQGGASTVDVVAK